MWTIPTNAIDLQVVIQKGSAAPFTGVLEPEEIFREKEADYIEKTELQYALDTCKLNRYQTAAEHETMQQYAVGFGFAAGVILTLVLTR